MTYICTIRKVRKKRKEGWATQVEQLLFLSFFLLPLHNYKNNRKTNISTIKFWCRVKYCLLIKSLSSSLHFIYVWNKKCPHTHTHISFGSIGLHVSVFAKIFYPSSFKSVLYITREKISFFFYWFYRYTNINTNTYVGVGVCVHAPNYTEKHGRTIATKKKKEHCRTILLVPYCIYSMHL